MVQVSAKIYINGRFLQQPVTGVQRYGRELLKAWDDLLARGEIDQRRVRFQVLVPRCPIDVPKLRHIEVRPAGWFAGQLWTQLELPILSRDGLLFSPDNLHPVLFRFLGPSVVTIHDLTYKLYPAAHTAAFKFLYRFLISKAIRHAESLLTDSQAEKNNIVSHYPNAKDRIVAVHLGAPSSSSGVSDDLPVVGGELHERFVLWVGTLGQRKNPQGAIDAMTRLNYELRLPLVMVGTTYRGVQNRKLRLPPGKVIRCRNRVLSNAELEALYRRAVCLLFPSFYEGFGLPTLEAMAYSCPVVASDIPVMHEICGDAAVYCDPNDPVDIMEKVRMVAENAELRERMRSLGALRAKMFTWENCARKTYAVLDEVISKHGLAGC